MVAGIRRNRFEDAIGWYWQSYWYQGGQQIWGKINQESEGGADKAKANALEERLGKIASGEAEQPPPTESGVVGVHRQIINSNVYWVATYGRGTGVNSSAVFYRHAVVENEVLRFGKDTDGVKMLSEPLAFMYALYTRRWMERHGRLVYILPNATIARLVKDELRSI